MSSFRGFAIVTVIHDSERDLSRLLDTIDRYLSPRPQVVIVDSGSSDQGTFSPDGTKVTFVSSAISLVPLGVDIATGPGRGLGS